MQLEKHDDKAGDKWQHAGHKWNGDKAWNTWQYFGGMLKGYYEASRPRVQISTAMSDMRKKVCLLVWGTGWGRS